MDRSSGILNVSLMESENSESHQEIDDLVSAAEEQIFKLKKSFREFEDILVQTRKTMNALDGNLQSIREADRAQRRRNETINIMDDSQMDIKKEPCDPLQTAKEEISEIKNSFSQMMEVFKTLIDISERTELRVESVENMLRDIEMSQQAKNIKNEETNLDTSGIKDDACEKLSEVAKDAIASLTDDPEKFVKFLMTKTFGKPKPPVLPILKSYYQDVAEGQQLLRNLKKRLDAAHMEYKEQRRLDINLKLRIDKLLRNIDRELGAQEDTELETKLEAQEDTELETKELKTEELEKD